MTLQYIRLGIITLRYHSLLVVSRIPGPGINKHLEYIYLLGEQQGGIRSDTAATLMSVQETQAAQSKAPLLWAVLSLRDDS